jgi:hypothetical protein
MHVGYATEAGHLLMCGKEGQLYDAPHQEWLRMSESVRKWGYLFLLLLLSSLFIFAIIELL